MIGEDATHLTTSYAAGERKCTEYGLLFFLGNIFKFKVHDDIILLCSDFYTADEVAETRKVMYAELKNLSEAKIFRGATKRSTESQMWSCSCTRTRTTTCCCVAIYRHVSLLYSEMSVIRATERRLDSKLEISPPSNTVSARATRTTKLPPSEEAAPPFGKTSCE